MKREIEARANRLIYGYILVLLIALGAIFALGRYNSVKKGEHSSSVGEYKPHTIKEGAVLGYLGKSAVTWYIGTGIICLEKTYCWNEKAAPPNFQEWTKEFQDAY